MKKFIVFADKEMIDDKNLLATIEKIKTKGDIEYFHIFSFKEKPHIYFNDVGEVKLSYYRRNLLRSRHNADIKISLIMIEEAMQDNDREIVLITKKFSKTYQLIVRKLFKNGKKINLYSDYNEHIKLNKTLNTFRSLED